LPLATNLKLVMPVQNYRELIVWQKAMGLVKLVYGFTKKFPKEELYGSRRILGRYLGYAESRWLA